MEITINKKIMKILGLSVLIVAVLLLVQILVKSNNTGVEGETVKDTESIDEDSVDIEADKIVVVHFHATQQCWSCVELGKMAQKTLENRFSEELESGRIEFLEVNVDLPENSETVERYQARGSSLFVNYIYDNVDHIEEEVEVWRLLGSEIQFRKYLGDKVERYL